MKHFVRSFGTRSRLRAAWLAGALAMAGLLSACDMLGITVFEILSVDAPSTVAWGDTYEIEVLWVGNPEWPVTWEVDVVECVGTGYCDPASGTRSSYENPLTYAYVCDGAPGSPVLTAYKEVRLTEANGVRTSAAEYSVRCE